MIAFLPQAYLENLREEYLNTMAQKVKFIVFKGTKA
jgi:hypothetical protein